MNTPLPRRVWLEIDLAILRLNFERILRAVAPCRVLPVLKANAYGLGVLPIARALADAGAESFAVAEPYEALQLLPLGRPVQILSSVLPEEIPEMVAQGVILPVTDATTAQLIERAAADQGRLATVHVKIDSGMGRLGLLLDQADAMLPELRTSCPHLDFEGIFTHFPMAYQSGSAFTLEQIDRFTALVAALARSGLSFRKIHGANSDAVNNFPQACQPPFNWVRTGINLHGSFDTEGHRRLSLEPILTLKTRLSAVRDLPAGMALGYGHTYRLPRAMRVGTISAGYADGLPLALSNRGAVLVAGTPCPVLGRISMDYTMIALDQVPQAQVGDDVVCLGGTGEHAITVEQWAALKNTHPYEIICAFGNRVERRYINPAASAAIPTKTPS